jgi:hypothetical protein
MPEMQIEQSTAIEPKKRGRKLGGKNKPGHHAGRPRKPPEEFPESVWSHGRAAVSLTQEMIDTSMQRNSSHCAGVAAIKAAIPDATFVCLDLQSWRFSRKGCRYVGLTPHVLQEFIINYDQGNSVAPINFTLKPAFISRTGKKRRQTPSNDELKDVGLRVAKEDASKNKLVPYAGKEPRKRRTISQTRPDGSIPITLGGRPPPVSVLARREFGLRALRR